MRCKWALLYIERWLTAPMDKDGIIIERTRGTPQGGVISPILSNLFLHYTFDLWMGRPWLLLPAPTGKELARRLGVLQFLTWGQRFGAEVYAGGNPGFEPPKTDPCVNG